LCNFGRDNRSLSKGGKLYTEDLFVSSDFDVQEPFSGGSLGVVRRKKDVKYASRFPRFYQGIL